MSPYSSHDVSSRLSRLDGEQRRRRGVHQRPGVQFALIRSLSWSHHPSCLFHPLRRRTTPSSPTPLTSTTHLSPTSPAGQRWSTWDDIGIVAGPEPWPDWLITEDAAIDTDLGILKTGKEADVFLLERATDETSVIMAAKRYRGNDHRMFHRDSGYTEGRKNPT